MNEVKEKRFVVREGVGFDVVDTNIEEAVGNLSQAALEAVVLGTSKMEAALKCAELLNALAEYPDRNVSPKMLRWIDQLVDEKRVRLNEREPSAYPLVERREVLS